MNGKKQTARRGGRSAQELAGLLETHEYGTATPIAQADPLGPTVIMAGIDQIDLYDRNPRRSKNRQYDEIKHSLKQRGFEGVLSITRRPGAQNYMVSRGANTTLACMKDLYSEGDLRFGQIRCEFKPWESELKTLVAHMIENDARDDLIWWDKARSVRDARDLLLESLGSKSLSSRKLSAALADEGHRVSHTAIALMEYTVDVLETVIPSALGAGAGRGQIEKIRALHNAGRSLWADRQLGTAEEFDEQFLELCRQADIESSGDTVAERIRANLEDTFAGLLETTKKTIAAELGARLDGRGRNRDEEGGEEGGEPETPKTVTDRYSEKDQDGTTPSPTKKAKKKPDEADLSAARREAAAIANQFAGHFGIDHLILPIDAGCGFVLTGLPDKDDLEQEAYAMASRAWWTLCSCSEQSAVPAASTHLPQESTLRGLLTAETLDELSAAIETYDPGAYGRMFWSEMSDEAWRDFRALTAIYRQIRRMAAERDIALW